MRPESLIGPVIGALGTIAAAWIGHRYRQQVLRPDDEPTPEADKEPLWLPASVLESTQPTRRPGGRRGRVRRLFGSVGAVPRAVPASGVRLWRLMNRLPPAQRRTRPALAAGVGWLPFGQAAYFRTGADVLVGLVLVIPFAAAGSALPDPEAEEAGVKTPLWASALLWAVVVVGALYAYLRSLSSNRAIDLARIARRAEAEPPGEGAAVLTPDERRSLLERRIRELEDDGWTPNRRSDFEAVVVRRPETDHKRQAKLTALTLGLWGFAWIYLAFCRDEERDVEVDRWGSVRVAVPGSRDTASAPP